jgi:gliotoxin/aspirochlorine biosynthesis O-methyltransferase
MTKLEESLVQLINCLQTSLQALQGDLHGELTAALHDNPRLPDKRLVKLAGNAIDLLHETELLLEPGPLILADHFLGTRANDPRVEI